jgi:glycosyltransferase involved in cell wall biosynthesis
MGKAGRERVIEHFSWRSIAEKTAALYETLLAG